MLFIVPSRGPLYSTVSTLHSQHHETSRSQLRLGSDMRRSRERYLRSIGELYAAEEDYQHILARARTGAMERQWLEAIIRRRDLEIELDRVTREGRRDLEVKALLTHRRNVLRSKAKVNTYQLDGHSRRQSHFDEFPLLEAELPYLPDVPNYSRLHQLNLEWIARQQDSTGRTAGTTPVKSVTSHAPFVNSLYVCISNNVLDSVADLLF